MKKKVLSVALAVALLALMVSGTVAYFSATDEVTNTFTVGLVKIEIHENDDPTTSDTMSFGALTPIVKVEDPDADESYIDKVVEVKNTGANAAYIRTHIAVPAKLVGYLYLDLNNNGWTRQADTVATVGGVDYTVFTFDHNAAVIGGQFTNELLKGVYLGANVDYEEDASGNLVFILRDANGKKIQTSGFVAHTKNADGTYTSAAVNVLVSAQAIQEAGFADATSALNSGFGANTNPWQ